MRFSLIVATLDRVTELEALLESLSCQTFQDFEVIIVDQNQDDRLAPLMAFASRFRLSRLRSAMKMLSHARNLGLASAGGDIIGFPDDDCIYPPATLARVHAAFAAREDLAVLTGPAYSPAGQLGSGRWQPGSGPITLQTVWTSVIAFNLFIGATWIRNAGGFDEALGVGARFGSAEETDLVIRIIQAHGRAQYDFGLRVIHPDKALTMVAAKRAFHYGTGLGYVLRKHRIAIGTVGNFFIRPVGGIVLSIVKRNVISTEYYWQTLCGRIYGFLARPNRGR